MSNIELDAASLATAAETITQMLRIRTSLIGLKLFSDIDSLMQIPGLRLESRGRRFTTCQLVSQCRLIGHTIGIVSDNVIANSTCSDVIGLSKASVEHLSGERMTGVWFENQSAAKKHQDLMPRVEKGRYQGIVASPLHKKRLDPPDIILLYANPAQMILFINGLQWRNYRRIETSITGESACADSWGRALATRSSSLSIPCYAERRFGGVADDELLFALTPVDFMEGVMGVSGLSKSGIRYPILPYGTGVDPAEGLSKSYG